MVEIQAYTYLDVLYMTLYDLVGSQELLDVSVLILAWRYA